MKDKQPAHTELLQLNSKKLELTKEIEQPQETEQEQEQEQIKEKSYLYLIIIKIIILWVLFLLGLAGFFI